MFGLLGSLPMWERGLKQLFEIILLAFRVSLPMWERGLKLSVGLLRNLAD